MSVREGWLIRDGEVLASTVTPSGWRSHVVAPDQFTRGVGAVVITGPALVVGVPVARLGDASRLAHVSTSRVVHVVGPGRHAVALVREIADDLHVGDDLQFREAP